MVNREYLVEQLLLLEEYVQRSRELAGESRETFLANMLFVDATIRRLTVLFRDGTQYRQARHCGIRLGGAGKQSAFVRDSRATRIHPNGIA